MRNEGLFIASFYYQLKHLTISSVADMISNMCLFLLLTQTFSNFKCWKYGFNNTQQLNHYGKCLSKFYFLCVIFEKLQNLCLVNSNITMI